MSDNLRRLSAAGVAIWLDDLSRERLQTGTLAALVRDALRRRRHDQPLDLPGRGLQVRPLRPADRTTSRSAASTSTRRSARSPQPTCATPATCCAPSTTRPTASTGGSRSRSTRASPTHTAKTIAEARALWWAVDRPNLYIKIPATVEGLPAIAQCLAEGISVNVTLIFSLARYREVMEAFLDGHRARPSGRPSAGAHRLGRVFLRLPGRHRDRQAPRQARHRRGQGAARQGRGRQRAPGLRGLRGDHRRGALGRAGRGRSQAPATAVGLHRRQGPRLRRHPVRRRPGHRRRGQHHAGGDPERGRRPLRRDGRHGARALRRGPAGARPTWPRSASTTTTS